MPADPETAEFLRSVRRRQRFFAVVGGIVALALIVALLVWPDQVREGIENGAQAVWQWLQMLFRLFG